MVLPYRSMVLLLCCSIEVAMGVSCVAHVLPYPYRSMVVARVALVLPYRSMDVSCVALVLPYRSMCVSCVVLVLPYRSMVLLVLLITEVWCCLCCS